MAVSKSPAAKAASARFTAAATSGSAARIAVDRTRDTRCMAENRPSSGTELPGTYKMPSRDGCSIFVVRPSLVQEKVGGDGHDSRRDAEVKDDHAQLLPSRDDIFTHR